MRIPQLSYTAYKSIFEHFFQAWNLENHPSPQIKGGNMELLPHNNSFLDKNFATITLNKGAHREVFGLGDYLTIGRKTDNKIVLADNDVSLRHARIEKTDNGYLIRDHRSHSGTFVNGVKVIEAYLSSDDVISIGNVTLVFSPSRNFGEPPLELRYSKNEKWQTELLRIPAYARSSHSVLLLGESGTGKELLARTLHDLSPRHQNPLIIMNCSAISESLIESELFGHVRGSFTGALGDRKGAFELARGGTLFLDEIGDLPLALQPKLLRVIENGEIWPVGGENCIRTDVRVIAATHPSLSTKILTGQFRQDLFYRLNTLSIKLPKLTERLEDFDDIIFRFAKEMKCRFSFHAIEKLKKYEWPGNIRQLRNIAARAAIQYPGVLIEPPHIELLLNEETSMRPQTIETFNREIVSTGQNLIKEFEREMIVNRLTINRGNQRKTATELGIPKSTLHDRIYSYGIDPKSFK
jgi:transcriptional regulator with AAA-type ATPase domain